MRRDLPKNGSLDDLTSSAFRFGVDFQHIWGGRRSRNWALTGHAVGSFIKGSRTALEKVQTSSNHYFQRPDATCFSLNPNATSLAGMERQLEFARRSAKHWTGNFWVGETTPGFEINDLGFATSGERLTTGGRISYQEITPGSFFRNYEFRLFTFHNWRHELLDNSKSFTRAYQSGRLFISAEAELLNYWRIELQMRYSPQALSSTATRGGPLMVRPASLSFEIRGNTELTLQFYAQPLISSGQYLKYKQLQRSESFDFDVFEAGSPVVGTGDVFCVDGRTCVYDGERYIDFDGDGKTDFSFSDKDFNIRSLRLNAVLRWEYRPGSTLFLVWQQSRRSKDNVGSFNLDDSLSALWDTQPDNAFILKLNYWFDL